MKELTAHCSRDLGSHQELEQYNKSTNQLTKSLKDFVEQIVDEKLEEFKKSPVHNNLAPKQTVSALWGELVASLPINNGDEFLKFQTKLKDNRSYKQLAAFYRDMISAKVTVKASIDAIMSLTLTRSVALLYSGTGKKSKTRKKENFSLTQTYRCLAGVIKMKFPDCEREKSLKAQVGLWLSQAFHREGGRKYKNFKPEKRKYVRKNATLNNSNPTETTA